MKIIPALCLVLLSAATCAEVPNELQGTWVPDIEESILLFEKNMPKMDSGFMRERYLPSIRRIITKNEYIHMSGGREMKADILLKERQGETFIMVLSSESAPDLELKILPVDGGYTMQTANAEDGSGNIVWVKQ